VSWIVLHVEEHADGESFREVLDQGSASLAVSATHRREQRCLSRRPADILMASEAPEALAARGVGCRLVPVDGLFVAEVLVHLVGRPVGEEVRVGQVDRRPIHEVLSSLRGAGPSLAAPVVMPGLRVGQQSVRSSCPVD
jgi:hypothetical protein